MQHINNITANKNLGKSKSLFFRYISEEEILSVVAQLNNKASNDCNNISMVLTKNGTESIIKQKQIQVLQLPHLYLLLFCQELTTVTHCCLVLLMM